MIMGFIREPEGVDFVVEPHVFTEEDRRITRAAVLASKARLKAEEEKWMAEIKHKEPAFLMLSE
jgi:hypothetical protein